MKHNMMRTLAVLLSVLLAIGCVPFAASADRSASAAGDLSNLAYILNDESDTDLRIVYLGGSVTEGVGSIRHDTDSWRALVGQYFTDLGEKYGKTVTNINAAIGATGSYFGAYRFYRDGLFEEGAPDVLFIEFSINDVYDSLDGDTAALYYESIIRQSYAINPYIQIIPVFTTDINFVNSYLATGDECNECFNEHHAVAVHYFLPELNVGCILADKMADEAGKRSFTDNDPVWDKYITDTCHPTNEGYKVYANAITDYLRSQLFENGVLRIGSKTAVNVDNIPAYCADSDRLIRHGRYISFKDAGFTEENLHGFALNATDGESYKSSSNGTITSDKANASFAYTFKGRGTGFYSIGNNTNRGALKWKITATDDPTVSYSGTVSLVKDYWMDLAFPAPIINGLEDREWLCECVLTATGSGSSAELRYIYVDGDETSVHAATAPDTDLDNPGEIAYVSSTGSVTVDGEIKEAYTAIPDAINALGIGGGRIFFTGTQPFADALDGRAKVTIIGLDESATLDNASIVLEKGDLELRNLYMSADSPASSCTNGHVLTFGEGITSAKPIRYAQNNNNKLANKINFCSGTYGDGAPAGGWKNPHSVNGDTVYNYYGGTFDSIYTIARETQWDMDQSNINGNVYLNINGGTFGSVYPAYTMGLLRKSAYITVNGGIFGTSDKKANLTFGSENGFKASDNCTLQAWGDYVFLFNNAEIKKAGGSLVHANVATGHSSSAFDVKTTGRKILVSNNHELISDTGLDLSQNKADVVLTVSGGKAELVRDSDGLVRTYTLIPDNPDTIAYVGEEILVGENGVYTLNNGVTNVIFKGDPVAYVSSDGKVTINGAERTAYTTLTAAMNALGYEGGTIYFTGTQTFTDAADNRAKVTIIGLDESAALDNNAILPEKGDLELQNLTMSTTAPGYTYTSGHVLTFGEGITSVSPIKYAHEVRGATGIGNKINFYSGNFGAGSAAAGYWNAHTVNGDVVYNYYGGDFDTVNAISRESYNEAQRSAVNGNIYLNVYGGNMGSIYPSFYMGYLGKSLFLTVNGGTFGNYRRQSNLSFGSEGAFSIGSNRNLEVAGDYVFLFNNDAIKDAGGSLAHANIGVTQNVDAEVHGRKIIVSSNHELASDIGLDLSQNKADVVLTVSRGKAELVRGDDGLVKTYTLTPDVGGTVPYENNKPLVGENGVYTLNDGTTAVVFCDPAVIQTLKVTADETEYAYDNADGTVTIADDATASFTATSVPEKENALFIGWYKGEIAVQNGEELAKGDVLTAKFLEIDTKDNGAFYVKGAQIRLTGKEGLRFINEMSLELFNLLKNTDIVFTQKTESDDTNSGCGFVILPESYLADGDSLMLGTKNACAVAAKKIFAADEHAFRYTVCVTDIVSENYARRYAVVPYIAYTSANGVECVFYGDRYAASLADIAEAALADESAALTEDEKARLEAFAAAKANA